MERRGEDGTTGTTGRGQAIDNGRECEDGIDGREEGRTGTRTEDRDTREHCFGGVGRPVNQSLNSRVCDETGIVRGGNYG